MHTATERRAETRQTLLVGPAWAILPLRLAVGAVFVAHGGQKLAGGLEGTASMMAGFGVPLPTVAAVVLIVVELGGGLALLLGLATRVAALLLAIDMFVAMMAVHLPNGFFLPRGIEFVLTLLGGTLTLAGLGAGSPSVDALWQRRGRHVVVDAVSPEAGTARKVS